VEDFAGRDELEIVDQRAVGFESLGADAGAAGHEITVADFRDKTL
jgi:hypothetical protein